MQNAGAVVRFAAVLFAFWVLLSGRFDPAHLGAGAATALVIAVATHRLLTLPPAIGASLRYPFEGVRWRRVVVYLPLLTWEVVMSSLQVAYVVLHPRMPIDPRLVRFRSGLPHTLARLTLSYSITLTPGTVTLDVDDDEFLVHALTPASARSLELGRLRRWVAHLFDAGDPDRPAGDVS